MFDLGGGTFDVTLLELSMIDQTGRCFVSVDATAGDPHLGGEDFSWALTEFCVKKFYELEGQDISGNRPYKHLLYNACEKAK